MLRSSFIAAMVATSLLFASLPAAVLAQHDGAASAAAAAGAEHGGAAQQPNILEPQIPLAFWTLVVFLLLLLVLWRFAWGPLSLALHNREHFMEDALKQAEHARAESERLLAEHRQLIEKANLQAQSLLDDARKGALTAAEEIRRTAQSEAESTLHRAHREIGAAKDQAILELWQRSANLAVSVAGKVLERELTPEDHRRLIDQALAQLPTVASGQEAGIFSR